MTRRRYKPNRRRQCEGKRQFDTHEEAEQHIWFLIRQKMTMFGLLGAYYCKVCKKYHTGHKAGRKKRMGD